MNKKFLADQRGANFLAITLSFCGLIYIVVSVSVDTFKDNILIFAIYYSLVIFLRSSIIYGTFVTIKPHDKLIVTSSFFVSRSIPLLDIKKIFSTKVFGGLVTNLTIIYLNDNGIEKSRNIMSREAFRDDDFQNFIKTLIEINPTFDISPDLLKF